MRVMGIDYGEKRIGVALSDPTGTIATPLTIIYSQKEPDLLGELGRIVKEYGVERIVVGLPRSLDGTLGPQAMLVMDFIRKLSESVPVPVKDWDERLSTVAVSRIPREKSRAGRGKKKPEVDATAAAYVLQGYLESLRNHE